jgi:hypothetical protein
LVSFHNEEQLHECGNQEDSEDAEEAELDGSVDDVVEECVYNTHYDEDWKADE